MAGDFVGNVSEAGVCADMIATIEGLVRDLSGDKLELQREASEQLRLLAKKNAANRDYMGKAGAITHLVDLLKKVQDSQFQVHAVTALLNMSLNHTLKESIVEADAVHPLVEALKTGSTEARENAAAALFSLSSSNTNKTKIGASGALPPLVELLRDGSYRGRRDAGSAIFNLAIIPSNRALAVRAGAVVPLIKLMADDSSKLHDEALAVLAILSTDEEGKMALIRANALPMLVDLVATGTPRNKENAVGIILDLGRNDPRQVEEAVKLGVHGSLGELASTGTEKGRRRASRLMRLIKNFQIDSLLSDESPGSSGYY